MWPAIISGVAGIIGSSQQAKAQREANQANSLVGRVADAEAAGLNPAWALSNVAHVPQQAVYSDAFGNVADAVMRFDEKRTAQKVAESKLVKENESLKATLTKIAQVQAPTNMQRYGVGVPSQKVQKTMVLPSEKGSPAIQTSAPGMQAPTLDQDASPYTPGRMPRTDAPLEVMAPDGMPTANPEAPPEFEADLYTRSREGQLYPFIMDLVGRNYNTMMEKHYPVMKVVKDYSNRVISGPWQDLPSKPYQPPKLDGGKRTSKEHRDWMKKNYPHGVDSLNLN